MKKIITVITILAFVCVCLNAVELELSLERQWNLIAVPGHTDYSLITDILPVIPPAYTYTPGIGYESTYSFPEPSKGFWVLSPSDTTITLSYMPEECSDTLYIAVETLYIASETLHIASETLYIATDTLMIGSTGAWQIIDAIELTSDTEIVTFNGISEEWDFLELRVSIELSGEDTVDYANRVFMRINGDSLDNYQNPMTAYISDRMYLFDWTNYNHYIANIEECSAPGYQQVACGVGGDGRGSFHRQDGGLPIFRIDIFNHESDAMRFAAGSKFVLLGMDID